MAIETITNNIPGALQGETEEQTKKRLGMVTNGASNLPMEYQNVPLQSTVKPGALSPAQQNPQNAGGVAYAGIVDPNQTAKTLSTAQTNAQNYGSDTLNAVQGMTQKAITNPSLGFDYAKYKQQAVDEYTKAQNDATEAARQNMGGIANTGAAQFQGYANQQEAAQNIISFKNKTDLEVQQKQMDDYYKAMAAGREQVTQEQTQQTQGIQNQISAGQAGVPWAQLEVGQQESALQRGATKELAYIDADTKTALTELQGKISSGQQLTQNDFTAVQANLERQFKQAEQSGDITAQKDIQAMINENNANMQKSAQTFQAGESALQRAATKELAYINADTQKSLMEVQNKLDTGKMVMQNEFTANESALNRDLEIAKQKGDITGQKEIQAMIIENQQAMQKNQAEIDRVQKIADQSYLTGERVSQQDHEKALQLLQNQHDEAIKAGDWANAEKIADKQLLNQVQMQQQELNSRKELQDLTIQHDAAIKAGDIASAEKIATQQATLQKELQTASIQAEKELLYDKNKFTEQEDALNRSLETAKQDKDINAQMKIQTMIQDNETIRQTKAQEFADAQRVATQAWTSLENVTQAQNDRAMKYLDQEINNAAAEKNYDYATMLNEQKTKTDMQFQLQGFSQEEKMVKLDAEIKKVSAEDNFEKQKALVGLQSELSLQENAQKNGFAVALQNSGQEFEKKIEEMKQAGTITNMEQEQKMWESQNATTFKQSQEMFEKNKVIEMAKVALQEKGINADVVQQQFNQYIATGNNDAAMELLKKNVSPEIAAKIKLPDPKDAFKNVQQDFLLQQYQFSLTNKDSALLNDKGDFVGLKPDAQKQFNEYLNQTLYNQTAPTTGSTNQVKDTNTPVYKDGQWIIPNQQTGKNLY
jgi:hypothetical protein